MHTGAAQCQTHQAESLRLLLLLLLLRLGPSAWCCCRLTGWLTGWLSLDSLFGAWAFRREAYLDDTLDEVHAVVDLLSVTEPWKRLDW